MGVTPVRFGTSYRMRSRASSLQCLSFPCFSLDWFVRIAKGAKDKEALVKALDFINLEPEGKPRGPANKARAFIEECGGTPEVVIRFAEETRASYKRTVKLLGQPLDQFEKEFEGEGARQSANPVYKFFFP